MGSWRCAMYFGLRELSGLLPPDLLPDQVCITISRLHVRVLRDGFVDTKQVVAVKPWVDVDVQMKDLLEGCLADGVP